MTKTHVIIILLFLFLNVRNFTEKAGENKGGETEEGAGVEDEAGRGEKKKAGIGEEETGCR